MLPTLNEHLTGYAMDRRGRGASGDAPEYALEHEFEDVVAIVESIDEPVTLLGHSFGAFVRWRRRYESTISTHSFCMNPPFRPATTNSLLKRCALK